MLRITGLALAALLAFGGAAFAAGAEDTAASAYQLNPPGTYPVVDEKVTISAIAYYSSSTSSGTPGDAAFATYLEDLTNVRVDFVEMIESNGAQEKFNLILASGDLPDILIPHGSITAQQVFLHGSNGTFLPLNDLIEQRMPSLKQRLGEAPEIRARLTMPDGNIYAFPDVEANCFHCQFSAKLWVYQPWVEKLGLKWPPETTEELYQTFKAFKTQDPNGNGQADEIPILGAVDGWRQDPFTFLMNPFIFTSHPYGANYGAFLERSPSDVRFVANTPEWREGLKFMRRLYAEGLLGDESFVWKRQEGMAAVENPDKELVGSFPAGWFGMMTLNGAGTGRFAHFQPIAPVAGPTGLRQTTFFPPTMRYQTQITPSGADRQEVIAQWADWFFEDPIVHGNLAWGWRREGIDWRWLTDEEKAKGWVARDGNPAQTLSINVHAYSRDLYDDGWPRTAPGRFDMIAHGALPPEWAEDPSKQEYRLMVATRDLYAPYKTESYIPPDLVFDETTQDELIDLAETLTSSTGLVLQRATEFINGTRDISSDAAWNDYVQELERAGIDRYVELWRDTLANGGYFS